MKTAADRAAEAIRTQSLELLEGRVPAAGDMTAIISREYAELDAWADHILTICEGFLQVADLQGNASPATRLAVEKFRSALAKVRGKEC